MEDVQNDHSVQTSASQSILSMTWRHLRPLVKTACRVASIAAARGDRHIEKIGTATTYIVEIVEVPVLAFGALYGAIFACVTGVVSGTILGIYTVVTFWPVIITIISSLVAYLWKNVKQLYLEPQRIAGWIEGIPQTPQGDMDIRERLDLDPNDNLEYPAHAAPILSASINREEDAGPGLEHETRGSWKVSDTPDDSPLHLNFPGELRRLTSPVRRHHRSRTGGSLNLSATNSPELIRTPMSIDRDQYLRRHRSGSSSPESYFRMSALNDSQRAQSSLDLRRHNRSGSSSTTSLRSLGMTRGNDRI